ncbi:D-alanyl-D-alanine carboxypeptidase family protein [Neobacillus niacini]|uniref:D-alanyl-D-alanine carboxypeptidase family protein n=1 Tax=Neobacillus niacini TaxID=86668 RepID=UPI0021CB031D|nr:D-alanyl-D-alanine carboxypeptidase family protein [Neobacillus niacini]MCM3766730.1 D-alanyl-D-alanine carboxypeptidase [Neobacillus niacini]
MKKIKTIIIGLIVCVMLVLGLQGMQALRDNQQLQQTQPDELKLQETDNRSIFIRGEAGLLLEMDSGKVLYEKNKHKRLFPASTTKILTALLAIENGNLDQQITVGKEVRVKTPGESTAWLREGQVLTLRELLAGLMLPSGNDAARTIAIYTAKTKGGQLSEEEALDYFVDMMNERAKKLGAENSHFMNPNGLHHPNHYSTAHDLGLIAKAAMANPAFKDIVSSKIFSDERITYQNRNQLLDDNGPFYFEGANGIKTGFTNEAGYCLVSSAERNGSRFIAVVLKSDKDNIWNDSISLLEKGFASEYVKK